MQHTDLHAIHRHRGQVVGVLFVPAEAEEWVVLRVLIDDGAVLEVSEVKHANGSISSNRGEHVSATSCTAEGNVVHLERQTTRLNKALFYLHDHFRTPDTRRPLCHERSAGSSHVQTPGSLVPTLDQSPTPRLCRLCQYWKYLQKKTVIQRN